MITIRALYDGEVFRPEGPVNLPPHSRVYLAFDPTGQMIPDRAALTFLRIAQSIDKGSPNPTALERARQLPLDRAQDVMKLKNDTDMTNVQRKAFIQEIVGKEMTIEGTISNVYDSFIAVTVRNGNDSCQVYLNFPPPLRRDFLRLTRGSPIVAYGTLAQVDPIIDFKNCNIVER